MLFSFLGVHFSGMHSGLAFCTFVFGLTGASSGLINWWALVSIFSEMLYQNGEGIPLLYAETEIKKSKENANFFMIVLFCEVKYKYF